MRLKSLVIVSILCGVMVACGTGTVLPAVPASPSASEISLPSDFTPATPVFTPNTNGAAFAAGFSSIAIPGASGYSVLTLDTEVQNALNSLVAGDEVTVVANPNGSVTIATPTVTFIVTPSSTSSLKSLIASNTESYVITQSDVKTNLLQVTLASFKGEPVNAVIYGDSSNVVVAYPNGLGSKSLAISSTGCAGTPNYVSASKNHNTDYISVGTNGNTNQNVCVASLSVGEQASWNNLSESAPKSGANAYLGGIVNGFGFPSTLNSGNDLVGYWYVGTQIYKVIGTYNNGTPAGKGFLNTTTSSSQTTQAGQTKVTFTNVPTNIKSNYVDSVGNVWVGANAGKVYVLRNGTTQWVSSTINNGSGHVIVTTDGSPSGATATVSGSTAVYNIE